jgi:hypothetical protein
MSIRVKGGVHEISGNKGRRTDDFIGRNKRMQCFSNEK